MFVCPLQNLSVWECSFSLIATLVVVTFNVIHYKEFCKGYKLNVIFLSYNLSTSNRAKPSRKCLFGEEIVPQPVFTWAKTILWLQLDCFKKYLSPRQQSMPTFDVTLLVVGFGVPQWGCREKSVDSSQTQKSGVSWTSDRKHGGVILGPRLLVTQILTCFIHFAEEPVR